MEYCLIGSHHHTIIYPRHTSVFRKVQPLLQAQAPRKVLQYDAVSCIDVQNCPSRTSKYPSLIREKDARLSHLACNMSDRREGDRYEEFHVGGHQATVHAGSNYNTYTINNTYHLYGPDARIPEVQHHEQIREERDQQALPTYPSQSLVQHGPIYNTNTYTITNNYNYYNRPPSPRQLSQDAGNTHQPQYQSSTPPLVGSGNQSESSSSLDVSMTEDSHVGETISSDSNSERTSNQVFQSSHYTERVQFSITTVKGARNTAFVGREVLMSHITEQISKYCEIQQGQNRRPPHGSAEMSPPRASAPFLPTQPSRSGSEPRSGNLSGYNSNNPADSRTHVPPTVGSSMSDHTRSPNVCVLSGLGGSGKTQMALEYYYEHRHEYFAVFWIDCEHDWTLSTDFAKISAAVIKIATDRPEDSTRAGHYEAIEASRAWLQTTGTFVIAIMNIGLMSTVF